jgi:hypothetical protein
VPWITGITSKEGALAASSKKPQLPEFVTNLICNPERNTTGRSVTRLWADSIRSRSRNLSLPEGNRTVFGGYIASCAMNIELFLQEQSAQDAKLTTHLPPRFIMRRDMFDFP